MNNKLQKNISIICLSGVVSALNGCASISSEVVGNGPIGDGIVYYMPKRSIRLNIQVANQASSTAASTSPTATAAATPPTIPTGIANSKTTIKTEVTIDSSTSQSAKTTKTADQSCNKQDTPPKPKIVTISLANNYAAETTPDLSQRFLLRYSKNLIGDNDMAVALNSYGLLSVSHGDTVSRFDQIASNIATDIASASLGAGAILPSNISAASPLTTYANITPGSYTPPTDSSVIFTMSADKTCDVGTYTVSIDPSDKNYIKNQLPSKNICGVNINIESLLEQLTNNYLPYQSDTARLKDDASTTFRDDIVNIFHPGENRVYGLFYKQDLPYLVSVGIAVNKTPLDDKTQHSDITAAKQPAKSKQISTKPIPCSTPASSVQTEPLTPPPSQFIALSPNESKTYFAPISKTLFTNNTSDITMANGVITSLKENTDSELYALTKIPADVLGSYTSAAGQIFTALGGMVATQKTTQADTFGLIQTSAKIRQCQIIIATNPISGLTGDALATALSNIKTGCGN